MASQRKQPRGDDDDDDDTELDWWFMLIWGMPATLADVDQEDEGEESA